MPQALQSYERRDMHRKDYRHDLKVPHTGINMIYNLTRVKYPKRTVSQV